jgi:hypothetical protein
MVILVMKALKKAYKDKRKSKLMSLQCFPNGTAFLIT